MVWRFLRFLGARGDLVDELTQETFVVWLTRPPLDDLDDAVLASWLRSTARNLLRESLRRTRRREVQELPLLGQEPASVEAEWQRLEGDGRGDARREALRRCLESLDGRGRRALDLHYHQRLGRGRIGAELGLGTEGVKTLLRRTRELLRHCIERRIDDER